MSLNNQNKISFINQNLSILCADNKFVDELYWLIDSKLNNKNTNIVNLINLSIKNDKKMNKEIDDLLLNITKSKDYVFERELEKENIRLIEYCALNELVNDINNNLIIHFPQIQKMAIFNNGSHYYNVMNNIGKIDIDAEEILYDDMEHKLMFYINTNNIGDIDTINKYLYQFITENLCINECNFIKNTQNKDNIFIYLDKTTGNYKIIFNNLIVKNDVINVKFITLFKHYINDNAMSLKISYNNSYWNSTFLLKYPLHFNYKKYKRIDHGKTLKSSKTNKPYPDIINDLIQGLKKSLMQRYECDMGYSSEYMVCDIKNSLLDMYIIKKDEYNSKEEDIPIAKNIYEQFIDHIKKDQPNWYISNQPVKKIIIYNKFTEFGGTDNDVNFWKKIRNHNLIDINKGNKSNKGFQNIKINGVYEKYVNLTCIKKL